jgi:hypothetical protein
MGDVRPRPTASFLDFLEDRFGSDVLLDFRDLLLEMHAHTKLLGDVGYEGRQLGISCSASRLI